MSRIPPAILILRSTWWVCLSLLDVVRSLSSVLVVETSALGWKIATEAGRWLASTDRNDLASISIALTALILALQLARIGLSGANTRSVECLHPLGGQGA